MKIGRIPFSFCDWLNLPQEKYKGESGMSSWRTLKKGDIRTRIVEYSQDFRADHWCERGHILLVIEGEMTLELKNGQVFKLEKGSGFITGDDKTNPHLVYSKKGAKVFIVD